MKDDDLSPKSESLMVSRMGENMFSGRENTFTFSL